MVKELTVQENDIEMYINIKKNYLATLPPRQNPPETDSKTYTKNPTIHPQKPKIPGKASTKKLLKQKKFYQTSSPSKVREKKPNVTKK